MGLRVVCFNPATEAYQTMHAQVKKEHFLPLQRLAVSVLALVA